LIQDKLLEAAPDLFRLAAEHFGKRVEFEARNYGMFLTTPVPTKARSILYTRLEFPSRTPHPY
jgi:hypothetical protein